MSPQGAGRDNGAGLRPPLEGEGGVSLMSPQGAARDSGPAPQGLPGA
jgi:hypothetical protein